MRIIEYVLSKVDPKIFYESVINNQISWSSEWGTTRCQFNHTDKKPSFSVNKKDGRYNCHGCGKRGKNIIEFYSQTKDVSILDAAKWVFAKFVHPIIHDDIIKGHEMMLSRAPSLIKYIEGRYVTQQVMEKYRLGMDETDRITIPIINDFGLCTNIRRYRLPSMFRKNEPKLLNYKDIVGKTYGKDTGLFPASIFAATSIDQKIYVCEGEFDCLSMISRGMAAVTGTTGANGWPSEQNYLFKGRKVVVCYDNDDAGIKGRELVRSNLKKTVSSLEYLDIPKLCGKDVNEWISKWKGKLKESDLEACIKPILTNKIVIEEGTVVQLDIASRAEYINQQVCMDTIVCGKASHPYTIPTKVVITVVRACGRQGCTNTSPQIEIKINPRSDQVLRIINHKEQDTTGLYKSMGGITCRNCKYSMELMDNVNIENILLMPTLDSRPKEYVNRNCYYIGQGLLTNRSYRMHAVTVDNPNNHEVTHIVYNAMPLQNQIETFELSEEIVDQLRYFKCKAEETDDKLLEIADWQSRHITKIGYRSDVHIAVDLAYHSVKSFILGTEGTHRGMLDILIIGDTSCGKTRVANGLNDYYGLGTVVSGENSSKAGLVGGIEKFGNKHFIKWGELALNNNRIVTIDEISAMPYEDIGKLSRVRSEGVAEINKIESGKTEANVRLIWMGNPRDQTRDMSKYDPGVLAIKELIGAPEDIRRFDFAITVAKNEVPSELINQPIRDLGDFEKYQQEQMRNLILWSWSRTEDQIFFTERAVQKIYALSIEMGNTYSSDIPLVQAENVRVKIAKIAAAIAARTFSTDPTCEILIINEFHVMAAVAWMHRCYRKKSMKYDQHSKIQIHVDKHFNIAIAEEAIGEKPSILQAFIRHPEMTVNILQNYCSSIVDARGILVRLVGGNCLISAHARDTYLRTGGFSTWLENKSILDEGTNGNGTFTRLKNKKEVVK